MWETQRDRHAEAMWVVWNLGWRVTCFILSQWSEHPPQNVNFSNLKLTHRNCQQSLVPHRWVSHSHIELRSPLYSTASILSGPLPRPAGPSGLQPVQGESWPAGDWQECLGPGKRWTAGPWWDPASCGCSGQDLETTVWLSATPRDFLTAHWLPLLFHQRITLQLTHGERYQCTSVHIEYNNLVHRRVCRLTIAGG